MDETARKLYAQKLKTIYHDACERNGIDSVNVEELHIHFVYLDPDCNDWRLGKIFGDCGEIESKLFDMMSTFEYPHRLLVMKAIGSEKTFLFRVVNPSAINGIEVSDEMRNYVNQLDCQSDEVMLSPCLTN